MRHAGPEAIEQLGTLREQLASLDGMVEKKPGTFYRSGRSLLHFHEDPSGLFADVRFPGDDDYSRLPVSEPAERARLLEVLRARLEEERKPGS